MIFLESGEDLEERNDADLFGGGEGTPLPLSFSSSLFLDLSTDIVC